MRSFPQVNKFQPRQAVSRNPLIGDQNEAKEALGSFCFTYDCGLPASKYSLGNLHFAERLDHIHIYYKGGGTKQQAALDPPEKESDYPEPAMFGETPAYGFFIRHVRGIELSDVEVGYLKDDARSPFILSDVKAADLRHVKTMHAKDTPSFVLKDVEEFSIQQSQPLPDTNIKKVRRQQF